MADALAARTPTIAKTFLRHSIRAMQSQFKGGELKWPAKLARNSAFQRTLPRPSPGPWSLVLGPHTMGPWLILIRSNMRPRETDY